MSEAIKNTFSNSWKVPAQYYPNFDDEYTYVISIRIVILSSIAN